MKTSLEDSVGRFIAEQTPLRRGDRIIAGLSGGADSVALLLILKHLGFDITALHCNFHLRGDESCRDEAHARAVASAAGVPFEKKDFDVATYKKEHGASTEMACRDLRYAWFSERRRAVGARAVAVAHHSGDNIETVILNLLRGTSINGVGGMEPFDSRTSVVRPLLHATRSQIEAYLHEKGVSYVTDSSNASLAYRRNRIRNAIMPAIAGQFPDAAERLSASIALLRLNRGFYNRAAASLIAPFLSDSGIDIRALRSDPHGALLLYEHLKDDGISYARAEEILAASEASGKRFGRFILDRGMLREYEGVPAPTRDDLEIVRAPASALDPSAAPRCAFFDVSLLDQADSIEVRSWRLGDRIKPWGSRGSKKVSDLLSDAKLPVDRKRSVPIVVLDGEILWVGGIRASRLFPIAEGATEIAIMRLKR